jgi:hypothetical protein
LHVLIGLHAYWQLSVNPCEGFVVVCAECEVAPWAVHSTTSGASQLFSHVTASYTQ